MGKKTGRMRMFGHFQKRLFERYGLHMNHSELNSHVADILEKRVQFIRWSRGRSTWRIVHRGYWVYVVFDRRRRVLVTALPFQIFGGKQ